MKHKEAKKKASRKTQPNYTVDWKACKKKEALTSQAAPQVPLLRASKKESASAIRTTVRFLERAAQRVKFKEKGEGSSEGRYRVALIEEGLGNTHDGFYYTGDALKDAAETGVFEGKKIFADHPSASEEQDRPERSVRDVVGHYEDIEAVKNAGGAICLEAWAVPIKGDSNQWAVDQIKHAIAYNKKYPDKDFIGLSINASGDAIPVEAEEFLETYQIPEAAKKKVEDAIKGGLNEVKVVNKIDDAVSCDLVTEAGAKGKILEALKMAAKTKAQKDKELLEAKKKAKALKEAEEAKKAENEEAEESEEASEGSEDSEDGSDAGDDGHDDADQDKELIHKALKKHGLVDDNSDDEHKENAIKCAQHYMQAYEAAGHDKAEAMERGCEAMKMAGAVQEAMNPKDGDGDGDADDMPAKKDKKESAVKNKESDTVVKLNARIASLEESIRKSDVEKHLEKKLKESKLPVAVTKKFREAIKEPKSIQEIDSMFTIFTEAYAEGGKHDVTVALEKNGGSSNSGGAVSLDDCVNE